MNILELYHLLVEIVFIRRTLVEISKVWGPPIRGQTYQPIRKGLYRYTHVGLFDRRGFMEV